ncbi:prolipoprotein diacylglyceryl transferase [Candidatus Falkowbacteria bacterium]|nr:prolipoprotein diacylglyceryl transferase [Candidatus Falkowbacteria bacterium]
MNNLFLFFHSFSPNSLLVNFGFIKIYWYGLLMAIAMLSAWWILILVARRLSWPKEWPTDIAWWAIIGGLIGARLYYVILEWPYYIATPLDALKVWQGGLAIHGAWLGGSLALFFWARKKIAWPVLLGALTPSLALGQTIGRWGNYFNQELFGQPTNLPWGIPIAENLRPLGFSNFSYFQPMFLYESLLNLLVFIGLWWWFRSGKPDERKVPKMLMVYLFAYGLIRFTMEFWRLDEVPVVLGWRWPQLFSLVLMVAIIGWYLYRRLAKKV